MDKNTKAATKLRMERLAKTLEANNIEAICLERGDQVIDALKPYIKEGDTVSVGGSMTLFETGVIDWLKTNGCTFHNRYAEGLTGPEIQEIFRGGFTDDVYLTSTNAITEEGELVNIDGNGNRVAAMLFGPKKVIVVTGMNKLVADLPAAFARIREVAAPANALRLGLDTPCAKTGRCMNCKSAGKICRKATIINSQPAPGRMTVILVEESLGY
ncbi:MAG: lactate utilization protein [Clostridia bacterium]|nr:lactate utilization protein [Clostridia bacterium]